MQEIHNAVGSRPPSVQIDDYSLVQFLPLDVSDEDSLPEVLLYIDNTIQYGEDLDVKVPKVSPSYQCACI